ncbi:hypothetical protein [Sedimenticola selenatireducens]|uniref:Uncharacterized protein n=1 Tax=Sedimenticola selenatireducens TaxID=191960 RepID=A0A558DQR1_9GAMM|nr:hypothetical protein [Sedimenticola selenatireducens]TVO73416.1 hypothetical protein FHP88_11025 [Sedimenticola selenatireducens]TVT63357.1 MAG: hypothetical protein FHK78_10955 [Sedimenticola selenatireducens]
MSTSTQATPETTTSGLCDEILKRLGWINSMALQVGSESFAGWSDEVPDDYAAALANYAKEAEAMTGQVHQAVLKGAKNG